MKVILKEDVKSLGKEGDIVTVSDGYARNFLLKTQKGVEATKANLNDLKLKKAREDKLSQEQIEAAEALAKKVEDGALTIPIKTGDGGKAFGSVSSKEIALAAKEQLQLELDKKKIVLKEPVKELGTYEIPVKLHAKVTANLTVHVVEET